MSQQEIVGEINMDHGQKGGSAAAATVLVSGVALTLLIKKILYVLGLDITQIENGIKKMIINVLKQTMRNKITLPIQLKREQMMIVLKGIESAEKNDKIKEKIKELRGDRTSEFYKLESFLFKVKEGMNKSGKEKKCKKFFGREGRLKINGKYWNEIDDSSNFLDKDGILKIFSNNNELLVKYDPPPKETQSNKKKSQENSTSQDDSTPIYYEMLHGILLDYFIEELINNDGDLPIEKGDRPRQQKYIIRNLVESLSISLIKQFKAYVTTMCLNHKSLQAKLGMAAAKKVEKNAKGGGIIPQNGGDLYKKTCNSKRGRAHELFDLMIVLSTTSEKDSSNPIDYEWYHHINDKKLKEAEAFTGIYDRMKKLNDTKDKNEKNKKMIALANDIFTKLGIAKFLKNIVTDVCDTLETLNADAILDKMIDNVSDEDKKAYQNGCDADGYETEKDGDFVHRDICDAFFSQSFWNRNFGARVPYITHSLLQKAINKMGDFQRDEEGKIKCSEKRQKKDREKDAASEGRRQAAKEKKDEEEEKVEEGEEEGMKKLQETIQKKIEKKAFKNPVTTQALMEKLEELKATSPLSKLIDTILNDKEFKEFKEQLKEILQITIDVVSKDKNVGKTEKIIAIKIIKGRKIFQALIRELKVNVPKQLVNNKKLLEKITPTEGDINILYLLLMMFDILYNQGISLGLGGIAIKTIQTGFNDQIEAQEISDEINKALTQFKDEKSKVKAMKDLTLPEKNSNKQFFKDMFYLILENLSEKSSEKISTFISDKKNGISSNTIRKVLESMGKKDKDRQDKFKKKKEKENTKTGKEMEKEMFDEKKRDEEDQIEAETYQEEQDKELAKKNYSQLKGGGKKREKNPLIFHNTRKLFINFKQIPCYKILNALIKDVLHPIQLTIGDTKKKLLSKIPDKIPTNIHDWVKIVPQESTQKEEEEEEEKKKYIKPCYLKKPSGWDLLKGRFPLVRVDLDPSTYFSNDKEWEKWVKETEEKGDPEIWEDEKKKEWKKNQCKVSDYCFKKKKKSRKNVINHMEMIKNKQPLYTNYILSNKKKEKRDKKRKEKAEKEATNKKGGAQQGGKLIGQGTYGCVFKPHLLCNGDVDKKDKEHVSKLIVLRREDDYRLKNEMEIGKIILKSKKYSKYFSPIISTCPIEFNDISDQDKYKCNSSNKYADNQMILAKLKKITGKNFIDTIENMQGQEALVTFLTMYKDIMEGIKFLVQKKIIHYDIKWDNVLYDNKIKRGMIIDFGLSFKIKDLDFNSTTNLKQYFYGFWSKMDVWCIDIQYICFLLHINNDPNIYDIQNMVEECISKNSLFKSYLNKFFNFNKRLFYENCVEMLEYYQYKYPNFKDRIKYIVKNNFNTWDNYALSIMYLKQYDLILKITPKTLPTFHKNFIKNILWKNIQPNPKQRLTVKNSLMEFNKLNKNLKPSEFTKLAKYA